VKIVEVAAREFCESWREIERDDIEAGRLEYLSEFQRARTSGFV
jgi:hypothetical protein